MTLGELEDRLKDLKANTSVGLGSLIVVIPYSDYPEDIHNIYFDVDDNELIVEVA
jgi:hypothetical protein